MENTLLIKHLLKHPSVMIFLGLLAGFTLLVVGLAEGAGIGLISTSFVKTLGKTLCLCMIAIAMDLVWGFCGILSLGPLAWRATSCGTGVLWQPMPTGASKVAS